MHKSLQLAEVSDWRKRLAQSKMHKGCNTVPVLVNTSVVAYYSRQPMLASVRQMSYNIWNDNVLPVLQSSVFVLRCREDSLFEILEYILEANNLNIKFIGCNEHSKTKKIYYSFIFLK